MQYCAFSIIILLREKFYLHSAGCQQSISILVRAA